MGTEFVFGDQEHERGASDLIGQVLAGKYTILRVIGVGGFGTVYEASNASLPGQRLAIKIPRSTELWDFTAKDADILCRLDHPSICRVVDFIPSQAAVVMQYIEGRDCQDLYSESGFLPDDLLLNVTKAVGSALKHAHEQRIAHRDVKPGNIIIDTNWHVILIDFGIAKRVTRSSQETIGGPKLTPGFAAPERITNPKLYDPFLSDIFEFGLTIMFLATGQLPYSVLYDNKPRGWDVKIERRLHRKLKAVLRKATQWDPAARYQSMAEMVSELECIDRVEAPRYRYRLASVVGTVCAVVLSVWFLYKSGQDSSTEDIPKQVTTSAIIQPERSFLQKETIEGQGQMTPSESSEYGGEVLTGTVVPKIDSVSEDSLAEVQRTERKPDSSELYDQIIQDLPPTLKYIGPHSVAVGGRLKFQVSAKDPDGTVPDLSAIALPRNAVFTPSGDGTGTFSFRPDSSQSGIAKVTFYAESDLLRDSETVRITVKAPAVVTRPLITVNVLPESNSVLLIDDTVRQIGLGILVGKGKHRLVIKNPEYPIFTEEISAPASSPFERDLRRLFSGVSKVKLQIGASGLLSLPSFMLKANGAVRAMRAGVVTPYVDLYQGRWILEFHRRDETVRRQIDSLVLFAAGVGGPRLAVAGNRIEFDLTAEDWRDYDQILLLIE